MNEATFEAILNGVLARILPSIAGAEIMHQTTFTLRLGHHSVRVDGDLKAKAQGRLDVVVSVSNRPAILLELKAPGKPLTDDDADQALSYARLLNPMPPLYCVTNGEEIRLFTTFDARPLAEKTVDEQALAELLKQAVELAATEHDRAVKLLLGRDPSLWAQVIAKETEDSLKELEGGTGEFGRPLSSFVVPRGADDEIAEAFAGNVRVVILTGPPLSGKTNVVAQFCRNPPPGMLPLYMDASSLGQGIWQYVANAFTRRLFRGTSADDARNWALNSLRGLGATRVVFAVDGWVPTDNDAVRAAVDEIVGFTAEGNLRLLLSLDPNHFDRLSHVPGRPTKTALGRIAHQVLLEPLSDDEFELGVDQLRENHGAEFFPGAIYNLELREPRLLRLHAAVLPKRGPEADRTLVTRLPPITDVRLIDRAADAFVRDPDLRTDLRRLATAFLDVSQQSPEEKIALVQFRHCTTPYEHAERIVGTERLARLRNQGFVGPIDHPKAGVLLLLKVPEILSAVSAGLIAKRVAAEQDTARSYKRFIDETQLVPLGDVVGARVLIELGEATPDLASEIIRQLLDDQPVESKVGEGAMLEMITSEGTIRVRFGKGMDEKMLGNLHPALVLSHLAAVPMSSEGREESPNSIIFGEVGAIPHLLQRHDTVALQDMRPMPTHGFPDGDEVACHRAGIVEPITQAMLFHLRRAPEECGELADWAISENLRHLVWRLLIAATQASEIQDETIAAVAKAISERCWDYMQKQFGWSAH